MYTIGICDDEKILCTEIEEIINEYCKERRLAVEILVWSTGKNCCKDLINIKVDLLFLGIEMTGINGIDVADFIRNSINDHFMNIVFVSFNTSYAMKLFQFHPFDFLVKPVKVEKLISVFQNAYQIYGEQNNFFEVRYKGMNNKVLYQDIQYFCSENRKINIVLSSGEKCTFYGKLKDIEQKVPGQFIMIHQSYIVQLKYIKKFNMNFVEMMDGVQINIGRKYKENLQKVIYKYGQSSREMH